MKRLFHLTVAAVIMGVVVYFGMKTSPEETVRVGGKKFSESRIMAKMASILLSSKGYNVEEISDMGSGVLRQALEHGQIDLYWEYTGTAYVMHHKQSDPAIMSDSARVYEAVKTADAEKGLVWLNRARFNNTYTLMMTREKADAAGIRTISDLASYVRAHPDDISLASNAEWFARPDGFQAMSAHYGFRFSADKVVKMESGLIYQALRDSLIDVAMGYSTDARIAALNLVNLTDDKAFFPVYNPAPVVRRELLERLPGIEALLNAISVRLDDAAITRLNYRVDIGKQSAEDVATGWLKEQGLL